MPQNTRLGSSSYMHEKSPPCWIDKRPRKFDMPMSAQINVTWPIGQRENNNLCVSQFVMSQFISMRTRIHEPMSAQFNVTWPIGQREKNNLCGP